MKYIVAVFCVLLGSHSLALAQGNPSGPGAVTGDPAASNAGKSMPANGPAGKSSNPSGSGTSPSGGKDDNPDHGFGVLKDGMNNTKKK
jgi:hypothetical protein